MCNNPRALLPLITSDGAKMDAFGDLRCVYVLQPRLERAESPLLDLNISLCVHSSCLANLKIVPLSGWPALITKPVSQATESTPGKIVRPSRKRRPVERRGHLRNHTPPPLASIRTNESSSSHTHPTPGSGTNGAVVLFFPREININSHQMGTSDTPKK